MNDTDIESRRELIRALEDSRRVVASVERSRVGGQVARAGAGSMQPLAAAIGDPARFWGMAAAGSLSGDMATAEIVAAAIRAAAARLAMGDLNPVREALIGQAGWLAAAAVKLLAAAEDIEPGYRAAERRAELVRLALKASDSSAKVLTSAAALSALAGGGGGGDFVGQSTIRRNNND